MDEFIVTLVIDRRQWDGTFDSFVQGDLAFLSPEVQREPGHDVVMRLRVRCNTPHEAEDWVRQRLRGFARARRWGDVHIISCSVTHVPAS